MTIEYKKLYNGVTLVTCNMPHVNSVAINVIVKVGSRQETLGESGISHFLEHMAFKGTKKRSASQIAMEFDAIGGQFNAYTSKEQTVYYCKVLAEHMQFALDIMSDILQNSIFEQSEVEKERNVILQEMASTHDAPDDLVYDKLYEYAFPDQPLGWSILGTSENILRFNSEDFHQFKKKYYTGSNIVVSIAGKINSEETIDLIEKNCYFPEGATHKQSNAIYKGGYIHIQKPLEQTTLAIGFESVPFTNLLEFYHAQITSIILGGGLSSRLFQKIREELGLAYSVGSYNSAYVDTGLFSIFVATDHENVSKTLENVDVELQKIMQYVSVDELARAKSQIKANILMAEERPEYKSDEIGKNFALFNRHYTTEEVIEFVMTTSKEDIQNISQKIFQVNSTLSIVGPENIDLGKCNFGRN